MSAYGPNTTIPTRAEAERDIHDRSRCDFGSCEACQRMDRR